MSHDLPGLPSEEEETEATARERVMRLLDKLGMTVERLRKEALKVEEDREMLLTILDVLKKSDRMAELNDSK